MLACECTLTSEVVQTIKALMSNASTGEEASMTLAEVLWTSSVHA